MSQDQDDLDLEIGTFAEAKQERKKLIAELRQSDEADQHLADVLAQCRKGNRCRLISVLFACDA